MDLLLLYIAIILNTLFTNIFRFHGVPNWYHGIIDRSLGGRCRSDKRQNGRPPYSGLGNISGRSPPPAKYTEWNL